MKKLWRTLGVICLGIVLLTGCGDTGMISGIQPAEVEGHGTESGGQSGQEQSGERITLTLGTLGGSRGQLQNAVEAYNDQSGKFYVEIVDYLPEELDNVVFETSAERFRMDIATGKGTDIIDLAVLDEEMLGYRGILADLSPFLEGEAQERYLTNILECVKTGNSLYELGPSFALLTVVGKSAEVGMENGWTPEEMMKRFEDKGRGPDALAGFYRDQGVASVLTSSSLEDFIDWEKGEADFCKEEFYQILRFGAKRDVVGVSQISAESIRSGIHLASLEGILSVADYQRLIQLFDGKPAVKGIPCSTGTGVAVRLYDALGINSHSEYAEGAWDFLQFYAEGGWAKDDWSIIGFRISRDAYEEQLKKAMVQEYYEGEPLPKGSFDDDDVPYVYAATQEEVTAVRELVALADRKEAYNMVISQIIDEEAGAYNSGAQTVEQTAEKVQNRVQLYLDEQKQISLTACAAPENGEVAEQEPGSAPPEGQPASEQETFLAAYRQIVEESDAGMVFSLINLDGDEIPELAAGDRGNGRYSVYTIKDGTVLCLVDSMTTEELAYFERSGIIVVFASWNGGGDEGGYGRQYYQISADKTLTDGDIPLLSYSYNAVYDEDGVYTGKGVTDYLYMGQETNESVYNEVLGSMGITEEGGRLCLEDAVFAEEMLDILK